MQASTQDGQPNKKRMNRALLNTVLLVFILVGFSAGVGYFAGYQMGRRAGAKQLVSKVTDFLNPLNGVSENSLFPSTVFGKVNKVNNTSIEVTLANGKSKTVVVTDKTQVTRDTTTLKYSDVKKDDQVTIMTIGKDKEQTATRIVLR